MNGVTMSSIDYIVSSWQQYHLIPELENGVLQEAYEVFCSRKDIYDPEMIETLYKMCH